MKRWRESASHVPVLTLLPKFFKIQRVLEIGSGELSTPLFLDKEIYPDLVELVSVEDSYYWTEKMKGLIQDPRWNVTHLDQNLLGYDLLFVDGPQELERRQHILGHLGKGLNVVHDFDNPAYSKIVSCTLSRFIFKFVKPWTAVFHGTLLVDLSKFDDFMKNHFDMIDADWRQWKIQLEEVK